MATPINTQDQLNSDLGTDAPVRTLEQTQQPKISAAQLDALAEANGADAGGAISDQFLFTNETASQVVTSAKLGVGSANDDKTNRLTPGQQINAVPKGPIVAQPNVLDQYASYTYSLSWYIMTPEEYTALASGKINISKWLLLMQSGGAQANVSDNGKGGRSPYFSLDYYMDDLELTTVMPGGGAGASLGANMGGKLQFKVTEPSGITLPNNLALAFQDAIKNSAGGQNANYSQALYCMVIKFYGYDDEGNLIQAGRNGNQNGTASAASPRAAVQKIYPFVITKFDFRINNRMIEYQISGDVPIYELNASSRRGSIPAPFELVGKTVKDILAGNKSVGTNVTKVGDDSLRKTTPTVPKAPAPAPAIAAANSRDGVATSILSGGSVDPETGAVTYAFGA